MTKRFAIALIGQDRPGITASLTGALLSLGCNVEDVSTSILRGHFALMLVTAGPDELEGDTVRAALDSLSAEKGFTAAAWEVSGGLVSDTATHVLTVYGPDRPGLVHKVATVAAQRGANICDMSCRLHEGPAPLYVLTVELHLPDPVVEVDFARAVDDEVGPLGFESSLRSVEESQL